MDAPARGNHAQHHRGSGRGYCLWGVVSITAFNLAPFYPLRLEGFKTNLLRSITFSYAAIDEAAELFWHASLFIPFGMCLHGLLRTNWLCWLGLGRSRDSAAPGGGGAHQPGPDASGGSRFL